MIDRKVVAAVLVGVAVGWWMTDRCPQPQPGPLENRPVMKWVARAARWALWLSLAAEKPPAPQPQPEELATRHLIGPDGEPVIDHSRGW